MLSKDELVKIALPFQLVEKTTNLLVNIHYFIYTEKNSLVNFTIFIKKFIIFLVTLGHTQNLGFLLF